MPLVAIHAIETLQLHLRAGMNVHLRDLQWMEAEATVLNALWEALQEEAEEDKRVVHELQYHELHIYKGSNFVKQRNATKIAKMLSRLSNSKRELLPLNVKLSTFFRTSEL